MISRIRQAVRWVLEHDKAGRAAIAADAKRLFLALLPPGPKVHSLIYLDGAAHHHVAVDVGAEDLKPYLGQLHRGDPARDIAGVGLGVGLPALFPLAPFLYEPSLFLAAGIGAQGPFALGVWGLVTVIFAAALGAGAAMRHARTRPGVLVLRRDAEGKWGPVPFEAPMAGLMPSPSELYDVYSDPLSQPAFDRPVSTETLRALSKASPLLIGIGLLIGGSVLIGGGS